ncbi:hypothetical protein ABPG77_000055 [Micractinium sp. CCAP 211/92]
MASAVTPSVRSVVQQRRSFLPACSALPPANRASSDTWSHKNSSSKRRNGLSSAAAAGASSASAASPAAASSAAAVTEGEREVRPGIWEGYWNWEGHRIRYQRSGGDAAAPAVLCVHGFGASACHWRKNLPELGQSCRAYAIDLLGYGYSDKPDPRQQPVSSIYNFHTWSRQLRAFTREVVGGGPVTLTCNSVGGIAGLQAAIDEPSLYNGVQIINISLRMLHISKQAPWQRPLVKALQDTLRTTALGPWFFGQIATPQGVKNVLRQCYGNPAAVTDELVDLILTPGLQPGAVDVFLDFISYSFGPLPEEQLETVTVPVSVVWGEEDPWEKIEWGREFAKYPSVQEFVSLPGVGHCPQDEAPHLVNPLILDFVRRVDPQ